MLKEIAFSALDAETTFKLSYQDAPPPKMDLDGSLRIQKIPLRSNFLLLYLKFHQSLLSSSAQDIPSTSYPYCS